MLSTILLILIALMIVRIIENDLLKRRAGRQRIRFRFSLASVLSSMTVLCVILALGKLGLINVDRSWRYAVMPILLTLLVLRFGSTSVFATLVAGIGGIAIGHYLQAWLPPEQREILYMYSSRFSRPKPTWFIVMMYLGGPAFIGAFILMVAEAVGYRVVCQEIAKRKHLIQSSSRT